MIRHGIPTAQYKTFTNTQALEEIYQYIDSLDHNVVVKASGLAAGKGVIVPANKQEGKIKIGFDSSIDQKFFSQRCSQRNYAKQNRRNCWRHRYLPHNNDLLFDRSWLVCSGTWRSLVRWRNFPSRLFRRQARDFNAHRSGSQACPWWWQRTQHGRHGRFCSSSRLRIAACRTDGESHRTCHQRNGRWRHSVRRCFVCWTDDDWERPHRARIQLQIWRPWNSSRLALAEDWSLWNCFSVRQWLSRQP